MIKEVNKFFFKYQLFFEVFSAALGTELYTESPCSWEWAVTSSVLCIYRSPESSVAIELTKYPTYSLLFKQNIVDTLKLWLNLTNVIQSNVTYYILYFMKIKWQRVSSFGRVWYNSKWQWKYNLTIMQNSVMSQTTEICYKISTNCINYSFIISLI